MQPGCRGSRDFCEKMVGRISALELDQRVGRRIGMGNHTADNDAGRADYLKRFYGVDEESPTQYDLVINTDVLSLEQAADLVSHISSR